MVFLQDLDTLEFTLEINEGVEFKLDQGQYFRTSNVTVSGTLFLDIGSEFR